MAAKKTPLSKSDFIRSQPTTLSAAEVVAKAKAQGIRLDPVLVYKVRGRANAKKGVVKASPAPKSPASSVSKAAFVRAHASLSPKEIVAKAKTEGVKFDVGYVYNIRGYDKSMAKKRRPVKARAPRTGASVPRPVSTPSSTETLLKAVASEIGLGRAMEILAGERARVRAVIGG
ncbi:MAG: hypothetical protein ACLP1X_19160 [Polyangiaceae bacterium]|jgi:hypothetical protein